MVQHFFRVFGKTLKIRKKMPGTKGSEHLFINKFFKISAAVFYLVFPLSTFDQPP